MNLDDLLVRLEWFVAEKERLLDAATELRRVQDKVNAIEFTVSSNGQGLDLTNVKVALDDARLAVLDERLVSLGAGANLLATLAKTIGETGKSYLMTEAANIDESLAMTVAIVNSGL